MPSFDTGSDSLISVKSSIKIFSHGVATLGL